MDRGWWWKLVAVLAVAFGAIWFLVPSYYSFFKLPKDERNNMKLLEESLPGWAPPAKYRLKLGLDLQGGIHMVLRVDTKTALEKMTERKGIQLANYIKDVKKLGEVTTSVNPDKLELELTAKDPATMDAIEKQIGDITGDFRVTARNGEKLTLALNDTRVTKFTDDAVDQAKLVIENRIDKWGVAEVDIRKVGSDSIQIALPGYQDPEKAKELIGTTALLEFRLVDDKSTFFRDTFRSSPPDPKSEITLTEKDGLPQLEAKERPAILDYVKDKVPEDRQVLLECVQNPGEGKKGECSLYRSWLVEKNVSLTGDSITGADVSQSQMNEPEVNVSFDNQGAIDFGNLTEKNVGRRMAIVLDDTVRSAPRINEKIPNGRARITMGRMGAKSLDDWFADANMLAVALKAGALPAPVAVGEIRQVGALLGPELIKKGSMAVLVGLALVVVFMALYYKGAGFIADVALMLNGVLILAGLAFAKSTLTLPGIAGFVLTLGIAVDANVLINERIREELSHGKTARSAVDNGYDRAFWTIFDAHVTTLIAGLILLLTGTGPVRGFAVALVIGIAASLFTSIVVTRVITTYFIHGRNAQTVSV